MIHNLNSTNELIKTKLITSRVLSIAMNKNTVSHHQTPLLKHFWKTLQVQSCKHFRWSNRNDGKSHSDLQTNRIKRKFLSERKSSYQRWRVPIRHTLNQADGSHWRGDSRSSLISSGSQWRSGSRALPRRSLRGPGSIPGEGGSGCCSSCTGRPSVGQTHWSPRSCCSHLPSSSAPSWTGSLR